ncbi:tRNA-specific adenosine deaminase 1 [Entomortierella lignicola]|nr:tRNA-specific adenosine deaminase 1 [Entomortierella lignicola]
MHYLSGDATTNSLAQVQTSESKSTFLSGLQAQTLKTEALLENIGNDKPRDQTPENFDLKRQRDPEGYNPKDLPASKQPKTEAPSLDSQECDHALGFRRGRIDYESIGVLRTKPGRVDSEPTSSMSCSDKIARWNILGLTSALVVPFLSKPIYLRSIITQELFDLPALERALYKRVQHCCNCSEELVAPKVFKRFEASSLYQPQQIKIYKSSETFEFSKEVIIAESDQVANTKSPVACSSSISWIASEPTITEVLVNGCKAGASAKQPIQRKARSRLCKVNMYKTSVDLWRSLPPSNFVRLYNSTIAQRMISPSIVDKISYREWKALDINYNSVKEWLFQGILRNWIRCDETLEMFDIIDSNQYIK